MQYTLNINSTALGSTAPGPKLEKVWAKKQSTLVLHFSHPFLGTYEVHQFLDLGYLEGTHSRVVYELHSNTMVPWNGKPIPYPTHSNTMSLTIPCHLILYHLTSYHTIRSVWGPFYQIWKVFLQAAILVCWAPSFVDRFFMTTEIEIRYRWITHWQ